MAEGLVTALERWDDDDRIRRLLNLLAMVPFFTPQQIERLSQVREAHRGSRASADVDRKLLAESSGRGRPAAAS
jgi:hypothetical protein